MQGIFTAEKLRARNLLTDIQTAKTANENILTLDLSFYFLDLNYIFTLRIPYNVDVHNLRDSYRDSSSIPCMTMLLVSSATLALIENLKPALSKLEA